MHILAPNVHILKIYQCAMSTEITWNLVLSTNIAQSNSMYVCMCIDNTLCRFYTVVRILCTDLQYICCLTLLYPDRFCHVFFFFFAHVSLCMYVLIFSANFKYVRTEFHRCLVQLKAFILLVQCNVTIVILVQCNITIDFLHMNEILI